MKTTIAVSQLLSMCLLILPSNGIAGEAAREDLSKCKLPHGTTRVPRRGHPLARKAGGYMLTFRTARLAPSPFDKDNKRPSSSDAFLSRVRKEKTGDILYSPLNGGTLVALSGKIRDLGKHFLYEFNDAALTKPKVVRGTKERDSSGKGIAGAIEGIVVGRCYLLETVDGNFVLIRILTNDKDSVLVQWVYQPNGKVSFRIPRGVVIPPKVKARVQAKPDDGTVDRGHTRAGLEKSMREHLAARKKIIVDLIALLKSKGAKTPALRAVVETLGRMRAQEAVPIFVQMIDTVALGNRSELTIKDAYPCVPSLASIGKPGSRACLRALEDWVPGAGKLTSQRRLKEKLLCLVVVSVEGPDLAKEILERKAAEASNDVRKANLKRAIALIATVRTWR